jgi:hypothetical protein
MITSAHNSRIAQVRRLLEKRRERQESGLFVIEGVRLVEEAWRCGWKMEFALYSKAISDRGLALKGELIARGVAIEEVEADLLNRVSDTETCQGVLAVVHFQEQLMPARLNFILVADRVRDPGNLGTVLRGWCLRRAVRMHSHPRYCAPAWEPISACHYWNTAGSRLMAWLTAQSRAIWLYSWQKPKVVSHIT